MFQQAEEGFRHFRKIGSLNRPVVHLQVNICCIVRAPWWLHFFVPDTLEVCRNIFCAGRTDQQVAAILEIQRFKTIIGAAFCVGIQSLICWQLILVLLPAVLFSVNATRLKTGDNPFHVHSTERHTIFSAADRLLKASLFSSLPSLSGHLSKPLKLVAADNTSTTSVALLT